jgi:hypothetical protein
MQGICRFLRHQRPVGAIWNNGYFFSHCPRCGAELIKSGESRHWKDIPKGYRVAWKPLGEYDIRW